MPESRIWVLVSRQLSGEISVLESDELQRLLKQHPDKQWILDILQTYFTDHPSETESETTDIYFEERFRQIIEEGNEGHIPLYAPVIHKKNRGRFGRWRKVLGYAAAGIGIIAATGLLLQPSRPVPSEQHISAKASEIISKPGARTKLLLPDGTEVLLNSGSKLNYQKDFNASQREVTLEGEAYFDVVKDSLHPFIVHTSGIDVKVLGTVFNVKSYPQDETIETTLLRGMIQVTRLDNPNSPKVILRPNDKLIFNRQLSAISLSSGSSKPSDTKQSKAKSDFLVNRISRNIPDSEKIEISWVYNKLVFKGDYFQDIAVKMERWYNVRIIFKDENLYRIRLTGTFTNETVREALNALQLTAKFNYTINDNEIEIYKK